MESCRADSRRRGGVGSPYLPSQAQPPPLLPICSHSPNPTLVPATSTTGAGGLRRQRNPFPNGSRNNVPWWKAWMKKYVILCLVCGGLSVLLGIVLIVIYLLLRSYTSSLQFFETIPTYVPGVVLIISGLIVVCFAQRRNRYAYLMKIAGGCCLICALLCVVITVTTTVVHMNRLQTLHECVYTPQAKTCMCVSAIADHGAQDAHRFIFNNTPNCEVVHGSLYSCLRALFSFSVIGILVCIFSSMLVYQLLSHEKKKLYWEQLELRRRFLYQRHPHQTICGCYDDLYPWQFWDMFDYRVLTSHALMPDRCPGLPSEEDPATQPIPTSRNMNISGGGHRTSSWNWLPWPRQNSSQQNGYNSSNTENNNLRHQSFVRRLMSRDCWNQQANSRGNNTSEDLATLSDTTGTLPWRSECIHIFRPSPRNNNCAPPVRFGIRSRNSPYNRHYSGHRRTRSNDGVFHHLHMNSAPRYAHPYPLTDASAGISCHFSACEIPRYMWGPPPPYSQPPSVENIPAYEDGNTHTTHISNSGLSQSNRNMEISSLEIQPAGTNSVSSKVSTPLSERRFLCHNFSSEGITLTIGSNFSDIQSQNHVNRDTKQEETCIVEVHVPYILHKSNIVFNTLPTRSCRKKETNPFKSLSNIPLGLSRKLSSLKQEKNNKDNLPVIEACCETKEDIGCTLSHVSEVNDMMEPSLCDALTLHTISHQHEGHSANTSPASNTSLSFVSYQPTLIEIPSDFKSSLLIATSPSTPVTENVKFSNKMYAQSMPNLSISNSPLICHIRRVPSSGNTSTSQDFADFEFEEDSSPLVMCSPVSDIQTLPDDNISDNSCILLPCPQRFRSVKNSEVPFSNYSSTSSCEASSAVADKRCISPTMSTGSAKSGDALVQESSQELENQFMHHKPPSSSSIILSERPLVNCSVNCNIHHLHRYHPPRKTVQSSEQMRDGHLRSASHERTNNFIVTIKSVNV